MPVEGTLKKDDTVVLLPDVRNLPPKPCFKRLSTDYAPLATLEWASEVAKAARGIASVATIEPPIHAPTFATL